MKSPEPRDYNRFAIVPVYADSSGNGAVPQNAIFVGSQSAVMERILDSRARKQALTLINDAEHARGTLESIRAREKAVKARETAVNDANRSLVEDFVRRLDALVARVDALEQERAEQAAHDPDDDELPAPPGASMGDDGELEVTGPPTRQEQETSATEDGVPLQYPPVPTSYVHNADANELPPELERRTPASGTDPILDPAKLAHPQTPPDQPISMDDR